VRRLRRLRCDAVLLPHPDGYCVAGSELISDSNHDSNREPRELAERCAHRHVNGHGNRSTDGLAIRSADRNADHAAVRNAHQFTNPRSHENAKHRSDGGTHKHADQSPDDGPDCDAQRNAEPCARQRRERPAGALWW
jgi:hypothetical protein